MAVKLGLLDREQSWWWTEEWQKGEREAEKEIKTKKLSPAFDTAQEAIKSLKNEMR